MVNFHVCGHLNKDTFENLCNILKTSFLWGAAIRPAVWSYFTLGKIWVANTDAGFSLATKKTVKKISIGITGDKSTYFIQGTIL